MIYFTSDTHFGHKNVIEYCHRPYKDSEDMTAGITKQWNSQIKDHDEVYVLGDFTLATKPNQVAEYIRPLKGIIHLIPGNHDYWSKDKKVLKYLEEVIPDSWSRWTIHPYMDFLRFNKKKIVMSHYPIESWREDIHLHGHTHGKSPSIKRNRLDVGWDNIPYALISIEQVLEKYSK